MDLLKKYREIKAKTENNKNDSNWRLFNDMIEVYFSEEWGINQDQIRQFRRYEYELKKDLNLINNNKDER